MFNSKNKNLTGGNRNSINASTSNSIGFGTQVEGTIIAQNDIRIDGELLGSLTCDGRVIIGEKGKVRGTINCQNAFIEGFMNGHIIVNEALHVSSTARIEGDVKTQQLDVDPGAYFNVTCGMSDQLGLETLELRETLKIETAV